MRIRMLVGLSGPAYQLDPGDERDFPDAEAIRLIEAGFAMPVSHRPAETTVRPMPDAEHRGENLLDAMRLSPGESVEVSTRGSRRRRKQA